VAGGKVAGDHRAGQGGRTAARPRRRQGGDRSGDDLPGHRHVALQILHHGFHGDVGVRLVPHVIVGDEGEGGIAQLGLTRELGLRHVRHPDDVHPPPPVDARLPLRGELGPLDADVGAPSVDRGSAFAPGLFQRVGQVSAHGLGHAEVSHNAVAEEGGRPPQGVVEELVGDYEVQGMDLFPHAAHGGDRDHPFDPQRLQPPDVGAEVQFAGHQAVSSAVAGQKDERRVAEPPGAVLIRGVAERRADPLPADVDEAGQRVESAAADDANGPLSRHATTSPRVSPSRAAVTRTDRSVRIRRSGPGKATST
jgi:hypothetical protein